MYFHFCFLLFSGFKKGELLKCCTCVRKFVGRGYECRVNRVGCMTDRTHYTLDILKFYGRSKKEKKKETAQLQSRKRHSLPQHYTA